jgi:hypothetical protein
MKADGSLFIYPPKPSVHHVAAQADGSLIIYPPKPSVHHVAAQADLPAVM